jgi:hypothetical protein
VLEDNMQPKKPADIPRGFLAHLEQASVSIPVSLNRPKGSLACKAALCSLPNIPPCGHGILEELFIGEWVDIYVAN